MKISQVHDGPVVLSRILARFSAAHHNKIQFFGYEVANIVLVVNESLRSDSAWFGLSFETAAALSLLAGSAFIWTFDFERRPARLYYGGMALTLGGLFLAMAGYYITGMAVMLASLETARGGLMALKEHVASTDIEHTNGARTALRLGKLSLYWYIFLINALVSRQRALGKFINERPFLTGAIIKAPLRLEFVAKKMLEGDVIGAGVGISWMMLGDGGLALNDQKLKEKLIAFANK